MAKYKRRIYCKFCDFFCYEPDDFVSHLEKHHDEMIPEDMTPWQFSYYLRTNKTHGSCVVCKKDTSWNEKTHKYNRFCGNPACKEKYKELFKKRMIGKYGKTTLLNDPEHQKKMLANRKISGTYLWRDHVHKTNYTGSYEKDFLIFLDQIMNFDPEDVMAPSPHTYYYMYEGKKHFYIPDFFIPSLGLEIEIKDGGDNPNMHHKIQDVDKVKEKLKDEVMMKNHYDYIKIVNKDNKKFFEYLDKAKDKFFDETKKTEQIVMLEDLNKLYVGSYITESVLVESDQKSNIDKNFKKKSNKSINSKALDIHSKEAKKYIDNDSYLSSLKPKIKKFNGEIIVDQDKEKIIGRFLIGTGKDKGFIGALRVNDAYKGYGYGNQLIEDAINKYNGEDLIVYKDNEVAREIYKKHGFVDVNCNSINNKSEHYMKLKSKLNDDDNINEKSFTESVYDFDKSDWINDDTTELFFKEDSKYDYEKYNYGDQYVKSLRRVEILKSQLKRGKITQEEFDKEYEKIPGFKKKLIGSTTITPVPKEGKKNPNLSRPNKNKPDDSFKNLKYSDRSGTTIHGRVTDSNGEKFDHYNNILKKTDDYNDYKIAFKNLSKLLGHPNACTIKVFHGSKNGKVNYQCLDNKKSANCSSDTKLYHTSRQKGLTRLSGKFRGEEGFYFSSKRVYFHKDNPGSRMTSATGHYTVSPGEYIYELIGDPTKAYIDPEIGGSAVFIETDTSVPVKDVTDKFIKNNKDNVCKESTDSESVSNGNTTSRTMQAESDARKKQIELNNSKYNGSNDKTDTQSQQLASLEHEKDGANKKTINKINKAKMLTIKNNMNDNKPVTEDADLIEERVIIPEKDFVINIDKWKPGTPLWITGTSGDGKSTLANKLAKENNAFLCQTDILLCRINWTKEKFEYRRKNSIHFINDSKYNIASDYVDSHPELPYGLGQGWVQSEENHKIFLNFFDYVIKESRTNPKYRNKKMIVEGCDITIMDPDFMCKQPLIILGQSRLGALMRRVKRDVQGENAPILKAILKHIKKYKKFKYLDDNKIQFKKDIKDAIDIAES